MVWLCMDVQKKVLSSALSGYKIAVIGHPEHGGLFLKTLPEDASALNRPQFLKHGRRGAKGHVTA